MMYIKSDKIITPHGLFSGYLGIENGKISEISVNAPANAVAIDMTGKYVSPGFIDIHTHGGGGYSFTESSQEDIVKGCEFHLSHGTTSILPTVTTGAFDVMREAAMNIKAVREGGRCRANILGVHMEGPYLSPAQCGAQCPEHITEPREDEYTALVSELGDALARWTYAPERDTDAKFCKFMTENGVITSAGHTNATYDHMNTAIAAGCGLVTHLYSCTSTVTRDHGFRSLGVIESTFLRDELCAEIIADGKHLPPELVRMIVKIKGENNVIAVTDSLSIAGSPDKHGVMSGVEYIVEDGVAKLCDRSAFAGSVATMDMLLRVLVDECGFSVARAVKMLSENPARIFASTKGRLEAGFDADIVCFDDKLCVTDVFVGGERV